MRTVLISAVVLCLGGSFAWADRSAPTLSYFQSGGQGIQWRFWNAVTDQSALFLELPSKPENVFWDSEDGSVYFSRDGWVFRAGLRPIPAQAGRIAMLPKEAGELRALWRERGNGRLRVLYMLAVEGKDVLTNGRLRYRLPDGKTIPGAAIPAWGLPYICSVLELAEDGRTWKVLARRATKDMAGETPGTTVVDDLRHERGASNDRLMESYTCAAGQCREEIPAALTEQIRRQSGLDILRDEASILRQKGRQVAVIFGTALGDELHMVPPVVVIPAPGRVIAVATRENNSQRQLGIAIADHYMLVEDEATGQSAAVFDLLDGKRLFRTNGWGAIWMISTAPVAPARQ